MVAWATRTFKPGSAGILLENSTASLASKVVAETRRISLAMIVSGSVNSCWPLPACCRLGFISRVAWRATATLRLTS